MKPSVFSIAVALSSVGSAMPSLQVMTPNDIIGRNTSDNSKVASGAGAQVVFLVECSAYKGKDGKMRRGARETCNAMCYGSKCKFKNFTSYTLDGADNNKKAQRRRKAGCITDKPNICKTATKFKSSSGCDEFPLASTSEADKVNQIYRCVPPQDNNSQGAQVSDVLQNSKYCNGKVPCTFTFSFNGTGPYKYCKKSPDCKSDGNFFTKGDKPVKLEFDVGSEIEIGGDYQLRSGGIIYSPSDLPIGTAVLRNAYANQTIDEDEVARLESLGLFDNEGILDEEFVEDEIVKRL